MTRIINLFAGPGAGKSTTAAEVFSLMKKDGRSVELVTEYAKDLVWDGAFMGNQIAILGEQDKRLYRLLNKVDYVITDSPLLLGALYSTGRHASPEFLNFLLWAFRTYDNQNFLLERRKGGTYDPVGRNQDAMEANELDLKCEEFFKRFGIGFTKATIGPYTASFIVEQIKAQDGWLAYRNQLGEGVFNGTP